LQAEGRAGRRNFPESAGIALSVLRLYTSPTFAGRN
jgi:hypothetical protein